MWHLINWRQLLWRILLAYIILLSVFIGLVVAAYAIPQELTLENTKESVSTLTDEGKYPRLLRLPTLQLDNFTDATMLNLSVARVSENVVHNAMLNPRSFVTNDSVENSPVQSTSLILCGNKSSCDYWLYGRYWHGYMLPLRLLLTSMSTDGIRMLNNILLWLLFGVTTFVIYRKTGVNKALAFFSGLLLCGFLVVPMSMQFCACYYISFATILLVLRSGNQMGKVGILFFIDGACTAYFDFLTVPVLTLSLPLLFAVWRHQYEDAGKRRIWKMVLVCCFLWSTGYIALWASKWIVAGIITRENILSDAFDAVRYRTSMDGGGDVLLMSAKGIFFIAGLVLIVMAGALSFFRKYADRANRPYYLLFIMLLPAIWFIVCSNHSIVHWWFTYRSLSVTIVLLIYFVTSHRRVNARIQKE